MRKSVDAAWFFFLENAKKIVPGSTISAHDYLLYYDDTQFKGRSAEISIAEWVGLCSVLADRPVTQSTAIVGEIKQSGTLGEIKNLEAIVRVAKNCGARKLLLPVQCMAGLMLVSGELLSALQPVFYVDPVDSTRKALDIFLGVASNTNANPMGWHLCAYCISVSPLHLAPALRPNV